MVEVKKRSDGKGHIFLGKPDISNQDFPLSNWSQGRKQLADVPRRTTIAISTLTFMCWLPHYDEKANVNFDGIDEIVSNCCSAMFPHPLC
jgi:hypothetical protein